MNVRILATFMVCLLSVSGCGSDVVESATESSGTDGNSVGGKGEVDLATLDAGLTVTVAGSVGTVTIPFAVPVPDDASRAELSAALVESASLVLRSDVTGTTANLTDGDLVEGEPAAPGEFSWSLNDGRNALALRFFNETAVGTTLKAGRAYTALFSIASNDYVESVATMAVDVGVVGE